MPYIHRAHANIFHALHYHHSSLPACSVQDTMGASVMGAHAFGVTWDTANRMHSAVHVKYHCVPLLRCGVICHIVVQVALYLRFL